MIVCLSRINKWKNEQNGHFLTNLLTRLIDFCWVLQFEDIHRAVVWILAWKEEYYFKLVFTLFALIFRMTFTHNKSCYVRTSTVHKYEHTEELCVNIQHIVRNHVYIKELYVDIPHHSTKSFLFWFHTWTMDFHSSPLLAEWFGIHNPENQ